MLQNYQKYRWFFTSSGKLVIGGKNAKQNEEIMQYVMKDKSECVITHTKEPGSPFCIILSDKYSAKDLDECLIFCGCFSKSWKNNKKLTEVHWFYSKDIYKKKSMKEGTFGVRKISDKKTIELKLYYKEQEGKARFIPAKTSKLCITIGGIEKELFAYQISKILKRSKQEIIEALPSGRFAICK
ncbi:DUF814 domain-containing protein [Candidatus Pacearchaeota archaeon]|nr:DUF814 domain-containing protein [Candidatus Pacearchaeota archaeon]